MQSTAPAIDHLVEMIGVEDTRDILVTYIESTSQLLTQLAGAAPSEQLRVVHGLKSSSAHVGAALLAAQCGAIESELKANQRALAHDELDALRREFTESAERIRLAIQRLGEALPRNQA